MDFMLNKIKILISYKITLNSWKIKKYIKYNINKPENNINVKSNIPVNFKHFSSINIKILIHIIIPCYTKYL